MSHRIAKELGRKLAREGVIRRDAQAVIEGRYGFCSGDDQAALRAYDAEIVRTARTDPPPASVMPTPPMPIDKARGGWRTRRERRSA